MSVILMFQCSMDFHNMVKFQLWLKILYEKSMFNLNYYTKAWNYKKYQPLFIDNSLIIVYCLEIGLGLSTTEIAGSPNNLEE